MCSCQLCNLQLFSVCSIILSSITSFLLLSPSVQLFILEIIFFDPKSVYSDIVCIFSLLGFLNFFSDMQYFYDVYLKILVPFYHLCLFYVSVRVIIC